MSMEGWSTEWPKKVGFYWFFGFWYLDDKEPTLHFIPVTENRYGLHYHEGGIGGPTFINSDVGKGFWKPVDLPAVPRIDEFKGGGK